MLKYFSKFSVRLSVVLVLVFSSAASLIQADPTDDLSFTLAHPTKTDVYRLMPQARVERILRDRLDLFPKSQVPKLAKHIIQLCKEYRFDPAFVMALIHVESSFRIKAVSPKGALGLMQVMPATGAIVAENLGLKGFKERALLDPYTNIRIGVSYLAWLRDRYHGLSPYYLVAAYNAGPGKVDELIDRQDEQLKINPVQTRKYFNDIRKQLPEMRYYRSVSTPGSSPAAAPATQPFQRMRGKDRV